MLDASNSRGLGTFLQIVTQHNPGDLCSLFLSKMCLVPPQSGPTFWGQVLPSEALLFSWTRSELWAVSPYPRPAFSCLSLPLCILGAIPGCLGASPKYCYSSFPP
jgi:hypothetical protein